jgi:tRNA (guanine37-N1)-methyltransferase
MNFHIITLFPESMTSYINESIIGRAVKDKKISVKFYNPRDFVKNPKQRVDQKPYAGGPGMVIQAEPVVKAIAKAIGRKQNVKIFFLSPGGKQFDTDFAKKIAKLPQSKAKTKKTKDIVIIAGRYEGIDERVNKIFKTEKISIGPYVLTGGELPALIMIDSISRQIPGVLGNELSPEENRISSNQVYTRPEIFKYKGKNYKVPAVLLSGNHAEIEKWKKG